MRLFTTLSLLVSLSALLACSSEAPSDQYVNRRLPMTNFYTVEGDLLSSESFKGKPTVVAFWAEWCPGSRSRIPDYNELAGDPRLVGRVNFYAVGLDEEKDFEKYERFKKEEGLSNLKHFFSGNGGADQAKDAWLVDKLPHFFVINTQGVLVMHTHSVSAVEELLYEQLVRE